MCRHGAGCGAVAKSSVTTTEIRVSGVRISAPIHISLDVTSSIGVCV